MPSRTLERTEGPRVRQFSVFLHNRVGALQELVKTLNDELVEVLALSVQDASDSAVARMIVTDPERTLGLFEQLGIAHSITPLLVVELKEATELGKLLTCLLMAEVNLNFSYPVLIRPGGRAALVIHVEDDECAAAVLTAHGFRLLSQQDLSR